MASIHSSSPRSFAVIAINEIDSLHDCNASEVRTYLALALHAGPDGDCWPGRRRLAEITGQSREHVSRSTSALEAAGLIEKSKTPTGRTIYHLPLHRRPPVSEPEPTPCQTGHSPMPAPAPRTDQTIDQEQREAEPEPIPEPAPVALSEVLRKIKTAAPDGVPASWLEAGRLLRPELSVEVIRNSAEVFLDHSRSKGTVLVDWLPAFRVWLRRERTPKAPPMAHKELSTPAVPSLYSGANYGQVAQETAEESAEKFAAQMARYGAVPGEGGTWNRPGVAVPAPTPTTTTTTTSILPDSTDSTDSTTTIPPTRRILTAEQQRRMAELVASGLSRAEVAAALAGRV